MELSESARSGKRRDNDPNDGRATSGCHTGCSFQIKRILEMTRYKTSLRPHIVREVDPAYYLREENPESCVCGSDGAERRCVSRMRNAGR